MDAFSALMLGVIALVAVCIAGYFAKRHKRIRREQEQHFWRLEQRRKKAIELKRLRALQIADVDNMSQTEFQEFVRLLLQRQGYSTTLAPAIDLLFANKDGNKYAVKVKLKTGPVSRHTIRKIFTEQHNCDMRFVFVTNSIFTSRAERLAGLILVDRNLLADWIVNYQRNKDEESHFGCVDESFVWASVGDEFF